MTPGARREMSTHFVFRGITFVIHTFFALTKWLQRNLRTVYV